MYTNGVKMIGMMIMRVLLMMEKHGVNRLGLLAVSFVVAAIGKMLGIVALLFVASIGLTTAITLLGFG